MASLLERLRAAHNFDVYNWATPEHFNLPLRRKSSRIFAHIRKCAAFVFWASAPAAEVALAQADGVLQLGLALGLGKPVIFIDPHTDRHNVHGTGVGGMDGFHQIISNPHGIGAMGAGGTMTVVATWDEAEALLKSIAVASTPPSPPSPTPVVVPQQSSS
jgi:hypothetical protein